jgi:Tfp pilus assembly protein PilF
MKLPLSRSLQIGVLIGLTILVYLPSLRCGYIWDDDAYVIGNRTVQSDNALRHIWTKPRSLPQYYPLVHTSYWIEYHLWGLHPLGYHLVNVLLHTLGVILLLGVLRKLNVPGAWLAAAVFAVHPVQVESVTWITERKNVLSGVFYFGSLLTYLSWRPFDEGQQRKGYWMFVLAFILFVFSLLSKSITASLPAAILVLTWWKRGRIRWQDVFPLLPMVAVGILLGLHTAHLEKHHVGAMGPEWEFTLIERILIAGRSAWFYVGKLIWPNPLVFIYPRWNIDPAAWWQYAFPITAAAIVIALWLLREKTGRGPIAAVLIYGGTLLPASGFFNVYPMRYSFVADHFQYLAGAALIALFIGIVTCRVPHRGASRAGTVLSCLVLLVFGTLTWKQQANYVDHKTLWQATRKHNPDGWVVIHNLAHINLKAGNYDLAKGQFERALELKPDSAEDVASLGEVHFHLGDEDRALALYLKAIDMKPNYAPAHHSLGAIYQRKKNLEFAKQHYERATRGYPPVPEAHMNLGDLLLDEGKVAEAAAQFEEAVRAKDGYTAALNNLGIAKERLGELDAARHYFERALHYDPSFGVARGNLDRVSQKMGVE